MENNGVIIDTAGNAEIKNREIRTDSLVKMYSKRRVVDNVSIIVHQNEIVGLLGPNGAGKTTTFYMIVGMIRASSGKYFLTVRTFPRNPCTSGRAWE